MVNKTIIFSAVVVVLALGAAVYFLYYAPEGKLSDNPPPDLKVLDEKKEEKESDKESGSGILAKDGFSINLPEGWEETANPPGRALALVVKGNEEIANEKAEKLGFASYFSVSSDSLETYTFEEYIEEIKTRLVQSIVNIDFVKEEEGEIDGKKALFVECESTQKEVDFKTLLAFINEADETIWAISFNTLEDKWPEYRDLFYQTAESFKLQ